MKMNEAKPKMYQYAFSTRCAFGECGTPGANPASSSASATATTTSAPIVTSSSERILRRTGWHSTNVAEQSRVDLPTYIGERFEVFVNGVPQREGVDYNRAGRSLVFTRSLR